MKKKELPIEEPIEEPRPEITFPEGTGLIIREILKKYGLYKSFTDKVEKLRTLKEGTERKKIINSLSGYRISQFVVDYTRGKQTLEKLSIILQKDVHVSEKVAKDITKDVYEQLIVLIEPLKKQTSTKKTFSEPKSPPPKPSFNKPPPRKGPDPYKETLK
ncbi:hypothetical protein ACFL06_00265 [Patescibacteria group bacterium]